MQLKKITGVIAATAISILSAGQETGEVRRLLDNERFAAAEELLEKKISGGTEDPELNYLMVKTYLEQEKTEEAGRFVEGHRLNEPAGDEGWINNIAYARYLLNTGKKEDAFRIFAGILEIKRNTKKPEILVPIAEAHITAENGNLQEAIALLVKAGDKHENDPEIDILKGIAYRKLGDASNAYKSYQQALRKDPDNLKANYLMGKIFTAQKNPEIYLPYFMKAYATDSTFAPVLDELYDHYYYRDSRLAKKYLEKYIAHSDPSLQHEYAWTDILYINREYNAAIESANAIIEKTREEAQPRLYKLIAYSYAGKGDSVKAASSLDIYFAREEATKIIAPDYALKAGLTARTAGQEMQAIELYNKAFELDSVVTAKAGYAMKMAALYQQLKDHSNQAVWLKYVYEQKEKKTNLDLFYWGMAHFNAKEYALADSVFVKYTESYPENIYGYYWRGLINAAIDTGMTTGNAVPHYVKVVELGEKDMTANKNMLAKAYGYLGAYEANSTKDFEKALSWFEKFLVIDRDNADALRYTETLKEWIAAKEKDKETGKEDEKEKVSETGN